MFKDVSSYVECKIEHFKPRKMVLIEWFYFSILAANQIDVFVGQREKLVS